MQAQDKRIYTHISLGRLFRQGSSYHKRESERTFNRIHSRVVYTRAQDISSLYLDHEDLLPSNPPRSLSTANDLIDDGFRHVPNDDRVS